MLSPLTWVWVLIPITMLSLAPLVHGSPDTIRIFPPGSQPYGLPIEKHIENFWKWQISIPDAPEGEHPIDDLTGEQCGRGQQPANSTVFYLSGSGGNTVNRTCEVPAGMGLLIPVMTMVATDKEYPGSSIAELARVAKADQDSVSDVSLDVDGKNYIFEDLKPFRNSTGEFQVTFPDKGIFGIAKGGPSKAVADGYYLITEPLPPGQHNINFKGTLDLPTSIFTHDITYLVTAK